MLAILVMLAPSYEDDEDFAIEVGDRDERAYSVRMPAGQQPEDELLPLGARCILVHPKATERSFILR